MLFVFQPLSYVIECGNSGKITLTFSYEQDIIENNKEPKRLKKVKMLIFVC